MKTFIRMTLAAAALGLLAACSGGEPRTENGPKAIVLGFSPKFGALIQGIPGAVLGGVSIVVFGLIAAAGARIWVENKVDFGDNRNLIVAAVTLVLGAGDFTLKLGGFTLGGIGTATFGAILLHLALGARREDERL